MFDKADDIFFFDINYMLVQNNEGQKDGRKELAIARVVFLWFDSLFTHQCTYWAQLPFPFQRPVLFFAISAVSRRLLNDFHVRQRPTKKIRTI